MLLDAALATLIISLLAGGRLRRLPDLDLRAPALFVAAALAKVGLGVMGWRGWPPAAQFGGALNIGSYLLLLIAVVLNRHLWGMRIAALGVFLNLLVIAANAGSMPVDRDLAVRAGDVGLVRLLDSPAYIVHKPATPSTRLRVLGDVLPLPLIVPRPRFFVPGSAGDVALTAGACWLILTGLGAFGLHRRSRAGAAERGSTG